MAVLVVYSVVGFLLGFVLLLKLGGLWWVSIAPDAGMILGSLGVGAGTMIAGRRPCLGGGIIVLGAIASSASVGTLAGLFGSTDWHLILELAVGCVVFLGGVPVLLGLSFCIAGWRRGRLES